MTAQVDKILQDLPKFKQSRREQRQTIGAHYYLGTIIENRLNINLRLENKFEK